MTERRLAAILAADVVGYTAMMRRDDAGTLEKLRHHRAEVFDPVVVAQRGRVVKQMGDGTIVEFPSIHAAVDAGLEIQRAALETGGDITLRIGVELGDVIVADGDLFGDGVNMATRLEALCVPGGLCISHTVRQLLGRKSAEPFSDGGTHAIKGIDTPVRLWRWHPDPMQAAHVLAPEGDAAGALPAVPSIAIIPLANSSGDPAQEYVADGLTEDIITRLSYLRGIKVASRTSSFVFKNAASDIRQIGAELGVRHALEGSVRVSGNRIRVNVKLADCSSGTGQWATRYDRRMVDIFDVQDEITHAIVTELQVKLTDGEMVYDPGGTEDYAAWELFQQGAALHLRYTSEDLMRARRLFAQAFAVDPAFLDARVFLAWTYWQRYRSGFAAEPAEELATCRHLVDALTSEGHATANLLHLDAATRLLERDYDGAVDLSSKARTLGPSRLFGYTPAAVVNIYAGYLDVAEDILRETVRTIPSTPNDTIYNLACVAAMTGDHARSVALANEYFGRVPTDLFAYTARVIAYGLAGDAAEAQAVMKRFREVYPAYRLADWIAHEPFRDEAMLARLAGVLKAAGLPD